MQVGEAAELSLDAVLPLGVDTPQQLEGDPVLLVVVVGGIDDPHAACAQLAFDLEAPAAQRASRAQLHVLESHLPILSSRARTGRWAPCARSPHGCAAVGVHVQDQNARSCPAAALP